tara:strand:+ start:83 stop:694 length:612 start_codon:yes stop_codon:yes gene_type:complete
MNKAEVINYLHKKLSFSKESTKKLETYENMLLDYNKSYNLIAKSTEVNLWERHILDSAQIIKYLPTNTKEISDLGSGAGLPGVILSIYDRNNTFHVKLYDKSSVKRQFLNKVLKKLDLNFEVKKNIYEDDLDSDVIVARAFKKLPEILRISREIIKKPHKLIILKGKDAQSAINKVSMTQNYSYKVHKSVTDIDSRILIIDKK